MTTAEKEAWEIIKKEYILDIKRLYLCSLIEDALPNDEVKQVIKDKIRTGLVNNHHAVFLFLSESDKQAKQKRIAFLDAMIEGKEPTEDLMKEIERI